MKFREEKQVSFNGQKNKLQNFFLIKDNLPKKFSEENKTIFLILTNCQVFFFINNLDVET